MKRKDGEIILGKQIQVTDIIHSEVDKTTLPFVIKSKVKPPPSKKD